VLQAAGQAANSMPNVECWVSALGGRLQRGSELLLRFAQLQAMQRAPLQRPTARHASSTFHRTSLTDAVEKDGIIAETNQGR
jgi:hypothetical protein